MAMIDRLALAAMILPLLVVGAVVLSWGCSSGSGDQEEAVRAPEERTPADRGPQPPKKRVRKIPDPVPEDGFTLKGKPKPGDWLHHFPEEGQPFEEYVEDCANLRSPERETFTILPFGDFSDEEEKVLEVMAEYARAYYDLPVKVLPRKPHFENGYIEDRGQWNADMLLGQIRDVLPEDAFALAGITCDDLFSRGLNFVFGLGSLNARCGVYSLHRLRWGADEQLFLERALNLMIHEVGHVFSLEHCIKYECVMNGSNSLRESDSQPMHACPDCLRKFEWNLMFDRQERYRNLEKFYRKHGFAAEAEWVAERLKSARRSEP
jgi:archaemetzincin